MAVKTIYGKLREKKRKGLLALLAGFILLSIVANAYSQEAPHKHVLILHSYHKGLEWNDEITKGIEYVFKDRGKKTDIFYEYMDAKRFYDKKHLENLYQTLSHKFSSKPFDVVIASDDHAFNFLLEYADALFPGTPIVFCGVNRLEKDALTGRKLFTGVLEATDLTKTINLALSLHPNKKNIFVLVDKTVSGLAHRKQIEDIRAQFGKGLTFELLENVESSFIKEKLSKLTEDSLVLWMNLYSDRQGDPITLEDVRIWLEEYCNVPAYSLWANRVDKGILGGVVISGYTQGKTAAILARKILNGEKAEKLEIIKKSPNLYKFNYKQMLRFGIEVSDLPKGSIVVEPPSSYYTEHKILVWTASGSVVILAGIIIMLLVNIQKRKRAEKELRASEENLRTILMAADNVAFVTTDIGGEDTRILGFSSGAEKIFGYRADEVIGKKVAILHKPEVIKDFPEMQKALFEGKKGFSGETELVRKTGETFTGLFTLHEFRDSNGKVIGTLGTTIDITERKRSEKEVKKIEERFRTVVEQSTAAIEIYDPKGKLLLVNDAWAEFWDLEKETVSDFNIFEDPQCEKTGLTPAFRRAQKGSPTMISDVVYEPEESGLKGGRNRWISARMFPVKDSEGEVQNIILTYDDITQRKEVEGELKVAKEKAESLNAAKTEFLMNVSHDIRTPMNVINGFNELLLKTSLNEEQKKFCKMIKRKGRDLIHLVEDIVDISAVEKGKVRMQYSTMCVRDLIDEIQQTFELRKGEKDIVFQVKISDDIPEELISDPIRLKQILENLCGNALKYTDSGMISVVVEGDKDVNEEGVWIINFVIEDSGEGISRENIKHIFEPYTRYYVLGKGEEKEGVGLGLHIVETLLKELGGEISVESELGKGSKFSFKLKMKGPGDQALAAVPAGKEDGVMLDDLSHMKILIAEDDADNRELMARTFESAKCIVEFAHDGEEAYKKVETENYDMVFMDLRMPKMDGFETTVKIRKELGKDIPIVALTAHVVDLLEEKCKTAGMNGYIAKPIDIEKLNKAIREHSSGAGGRQSDAQRT